jgi:hypothetical protein
MPLLYSSFLGGVGGAGPAGDPHYGNVILLSGFEGADAATATDDESPAARGAASFFSAAKLSTTTPLVGASSLLLDGNVDRVTWPDSADWTMTGEFTLDVVVQFSALVGSTFPTLICQDGGGGSGNRAFLLGVNIGTNRFGLTVSADGSAASFANVDVTGGLQTGVPYHVRAHRDGSNVLRVAYRKLSDGAMTGPGATAILEGMFASSRALEIGGSDISTATNHVSGRIDEVRITAGVARAIDEVVALPFPRLAA